MRARFKDNTNLLALTLLIHLLVIFGVGAVWYALGGNGGVVGSVMGGLLALSVGTLSLIKGRGEGNTPKPLWPPLMLLVEPAAILIVALLALVGSVIWGSRPVDLTHDFALSPAGPFKEGMTVTATAHTAQAKPRLFVTFAAPEHDANAPVCAPSSRFEVRLVPSTGPNGDQTGKAGEQLVFELGENRKDIRLAVRMTAEPNCVLDLSVESARLDD